jgi:hypothetical protein
MGFRGLADANVQPRGDAGPRAASRPMNTPESNEDFEDVVAALLVEECDFLIVGAHALAAHGAPRATGDLDVFVRPDAKNAERVHRALIRFGAPLAAHRVAVADLATPGTVYQMGLPPRRIDILTELSGVSFDRAAEHAVRGQLGPHLVLCIGIDALIENKRASGRTKDLADVEVLEELRARR